MPALDGGDEPAWAATARVRGISRLLRGPVLPPRLVGQAIHHQEAILDGRTTNDQRGSVRVPERCAQQMHHTQADRKRMSPECFDGLGGWFEEWRAVLGRFPDFGTHRSDVMPDLMASKAIRRSQLSDGVILLWWNTGP